MRKSRLSADERRLQILKNARRVFAAHGYQGTRTRDIAKGCRINESTIYAHFKNKEDLFMSVLNDLHNEIQAVGREALSLEADALTTVRSVICLLWERFASDPDLPRVLTHAFAMSMHHGGFRKVFGQRLAGHHAYLRVQLERGMEDGNLRPDLDPDEFAALILGLGIAYALLKAAGVIKSLGVSDPLPLFEIVVGGMLAQPGKSEEQGAAPDEVGGTPD
jgi:AcrR family transcriptional regulator